jgi:predicted esterase
MHTTLNSSLTDKESGKVTVTNSTKHLMKGTHQSIIHSNRDLSDKSSFDRVFLLLHGYSEKGEKMMKRIGKRIQKWAETKSLSVLILAPNGLYPMPKSFPLGSRPTSEDLLMGFAWYFYDQTKDEFLIDYKVPASTLKSLLEELNPQKKPTTIIGYSQGGYLAPFVGLEYEATHQVIGLNCSFRDELFSETPNFQLDQIQGKKDTIIDTTLCHSRFMRLKQRNTQGDFYWIADDDHRLSPEISDKTISILK